jgi:hypothetical protein
MIGGEPELIPVKKLSVINLSQAILEADKNVICRNADRNSRKLKDEDAVNR